MPDEVPIPGRRSWNRFLPALRLIGAIRRSFDVRKLAIAALGLALLQSGWLLLDRLVPPASGRHSRCLRIIGSNKSLGR